MKIYGLLLILAVVSQSAQSQSVFDKIKERATSLKGMVESTQDKSVNLDYGEFMINYSCKHRGFNYSTYTTVPDKGSLPRYKPFHQEKRLLSKGCSPQYKTSSYKKVGNAPQYHRGHGVHSNIWDHDKAIMKKTNMFTNIVPHHGVQNASGLWRHLEKRVECARDVTDVTVYLGNDWGNDASNDHFKRTHGVTTPDYLWRVHMYADRPNQAYAWLIRNNGDAKPKHEGSHRVSLKELKRVLRDDYEFPIPKGWVDARGKDHHSRTTCSLK